MKRVGSFLLSAVLALPVAGYGVTVKLYEPVEWAFGNPSFAGNPYELIAAATFRHPTAAEVVTELYYDGGDIWKLRFTGTSAGEWSFRTSSQDPDLDGLTGTVVVTDNPGSPGFITKLGGGENKWGRTGLDQAFVPQLAMFPTPDVYHKNPGVIEENLEIFFGDHGFNGFHTAVFGRWFDINKPRYDDLPSDPNPDPRTFEALENLIGKTYAAGGVVHIWAWGDEQQHLTPIKWGINGEVDRRLQRYIAARLGPLPGWSMGYGFDLDEWVSTPQLKEWRDYLQAHLGWFHFLGGRPAGPNSGTDHSDFIDWNEPLDYSSYEHHRPTYQVYVEALRNLPGQPVMSEDRFRVRPDQREKDYTLADTRRGLWHSTMAGGVANIWGYQIPIQSDGSSNPYPNATELLTYGRFWRNRFKKQLVRDNGLTGGRALRKSNVFYVFYQESTSSIIMNLHGMDRPRPAVAVDTQKAYEEIPLGTVAPGANRFEAPYPSDWAVAVGDPTPESSVQIDLGLIDRESGLFRVNVGGGDTRVATIGGRDSRRNDDPSSDSYMYFNVVGSYAYEGNRPEVEISIDYYDAGTATLKLQYDSLSAAHTAHPEVVHLTDTNTWQRATWWVTDAFFGNRQNGGADFRIRRDGEGPFYLDAVRVSVPAAMPPGPASNPAPVNGATNVGVQVDLEWTPGAGATSHDVYLGTCNPPPFQGNQTSTRFEPGPLMANTTYFWRVDEVNESGTTPGPLWSFTTALDTLVAALNIKKAGPITIDGSGGDWNLSEFTSLVRGGDVIAGDIALVGFDEGTLYYGGRATHLALPTSAADHTARVYSRHDATYLYFLARLDDDDIQMPQGPESNWANDCVEFYFDPGHDRGPTPLNNSTSDIQLVIDVANQQNVYMATDAYRARILSGVDSAVSRDATGWWLEVRIEKSMLDPDLPHDGAFGLDFNFRDNDGNNNPNQTTVYTWNDTEQSGNFPSKIPDRWGDGLLVPVAVELVSQVGLNVHIPSNEILDDVAVDLGVRWIRVDFDWFRIEPEQGVFHWEATDRIIQRATELGLEVLGVLAYTPPWASSVPAEPRTSDPPASVDYWTNLVREAVTRYSGRVRFWQFWNEPNVQEFWTGSMTQYQVDILEAGARVAKEIDPSMQTVAPGLATLGNWRTWFTNLMRSKELIDVINHQNYRDSGRDAILDLERDRPFKPSLRTLMLRAGVEDKPFWLTETGRRSEEGNQLEYYQDVIATLAETPWVKKVFFYHYWDGPGQGDGGFGIVNEDFSPKPVYDFLQMVLQPGVTSRIVTP